MIVCPHNSPPPMTQFHLLARRGSRPLLMETEDFAVVEGPAAAAVTGGAPLPGDRPLGRPTLPNPVSRAALGIGLLLLLANDVMAPLPVG